MLFGSGVVFCLIFGCWQQALYFGVFGNSWDWILFFQFFQSVYVLICYCVCYGRVFFLCDDLIMIGVYLCGGLGLIVLCECGDLGWNVFCVCGCLCVCDGLLWVGGGWGVIFFCVWSGSQDWWSGRCWFWDCGFWVLGQVIFRSGSDFEDWQFFFF